MMQWFAQAPSNIALIKYMGKTDPDQNIPANSSLSYTLNDLYTFVELELHGGDEDYWEPLEMPAGHPEVISQPQQRRFLKHLQRLKQYFGCDKGFTIRSCNNFPHSIGLASSASSFAALTQCAVRAMTELMDPLELNTDSIAELSRAGSGSSCRSFYAPWALWTPDTVKAIDLPYTDLIHHAVIVTHEPKAISSSEAHARVTTSPLFSDRVDRAEQRLKALIAALEKQDWESAYQHTWAEFQDVHQLFATAQPSFSYMTEETQQVLSDVQAYWETHGDGPIATVDAGPNIHLLFRADQADPAEILKEKFLKDYDVI